MISLIAYSPDKIPGLIPWELILPINPLGLFGVNGSSSIGLNIA